MRINLKISGMVFLISFLTASVTAQDLKIGIFYDQLTQAFTFHCTRGEYIILENDREILNMKEGDIAFIEFEENSIKLSTDDGVIGNFSSLNFKDSLLKGRFMIRTVRPASNQRLYRGDLSVAIEHETLKIINGIGFDHYLAGVVEAEAGPGAPFEFFKVQAVLCRTYAIKNYDRHLHEGFNLCDDTHCQVFHGIADDNPEILDAVLSTHGVVVADKHFRLITAAYHSNSGGETQKANQIWTEDHDYLAPIIDPFSEGQPNYEWEEKLDLNIWKSYLQARGIDTEDMKDEELMIRQKHRKNQFIVGEDTLIIKDVREDFGLRSTFFNMILSGEEIILKGKGYGHGVGLSQEGAMEMARQGYSYSDILRYYYYDVQVKDTDELPLSSVPSLFR